MAKQTSQVEKFREAAREAGTDDSEERFDATPKNMAKGHKEVPPSADAKEAPASSRQKPKSS
jgi:hypothetical protein